MRIWREMPEVMYHRSRFDEEKNEGEKEEGEKGGQGLKDIMKLN